MAWEELTINDLKGALNATELDAYSTEFADEAVPERALEILEQVVQQVRGDITSHSLNTMSVDDALIPEAYHAHALAIVRYKLLATLPYVEITKAREKEYDQANKFFESVAVGKRRPEAAADARDNTAADERPSSGAQVVTSRPRITGRDNMAGL
ncbi:phage protein Gp36 family protein [Rubritalea sp.]|uniref:phage protein Gp36 family protein n=1 Tax=Rubritalea sp. TaxID=2109375 RepID=UPI003EF94E6F